MKLNHPKIFLNFISAHYKIHVTFIILFICLIILFTNNLHAADILPSKPVLSVTVDKPQKQYFDQKLSANGNVVAWQEAIIGTESNGLRLTDILVDEGDKVKRGQVLATFADETLIVELAQIKANLAEAEATAFEATENLARVKNLDELGALSEQQINQYISAAKTTKAKLFAQQAALKMQQLRLLQTKVIAPDSGVISSRTASIGAVLPTGQELFRLIRQNRLEWRAEVRADELSNIKIGTRASIFTPHASPIIGKVRKIAPTINPKTRLGLVLTDLPVSPELKPGMFINGIFELGRFQAITVPQQSVVIKDGISYIFRLNPDSKVSQLNVRVGRRSGDRIEIISGLGIDDKVVVNGAGFLNEGDFVKVVDGNAPAPNG